MNEESNHDNGSAPNDSSAIVTVITTMSDLLVKSLTSLNTSMAESFTDMKETLDQLVIEEGQTDEHDIIDAETSKLPKAAEQGKLQQDAHVNQHPGSVKQGTVDKSQKSGSTEQSINTLINQSSESQRSSCSEIEVLSGITSDLKLDQKKAPDVNEEIAKIVHGLMREKLADEVLTETQNRNNRPENCDCLTTTKVNHLIWDKLKPDTRSNDIKLQRVQTNLVKGVIPIVSIIGRLVEARYKIRADTLDVPGSIRAAIDAIALIGAANFELNMRRRDNIKPELNENYKHLCSNTVPFTESLFGNDYDLSKQLKDLAEATKVSKKLSRNDSKTEAHKNHGYRSFKHTKARGFGYKQRGQVANPSKHLNWNRSSPPYNKNKEEGRRQNK